MDRISILCLLGEKANDVHYFICMIPYIKKAASQ